MVAVIRSQDKSPAQQHIRSKTRVTKRTTSKTHIHTKKRATPFRHIGAPSKAECENPGALVIADTLSTSANESGTSATGHEPMSEAAKRSLAGSVFMSEHTVDDTIGLGDLDNAVHPIVRRENFPKARAEHYQVLEPSLRLASKILESEEMKVLLRTILFLRGLQHLDEHCRRERLCTYSERDCSTRSLTRAQSRDIDAALEEFAEYITFTTLASPFADAHTEANGDLTCSAASQRTTQQRLQHRLFFHGEQIAEIGFVMERRVFREHFGFVYGNGRLNGKETVRRHRTSGGVLSGLVGVPVWWEWPCTWLVKEYYASGDLALWGRRGWEERLRGEDVARRIYPGELERYFTRAFWEEGGSGKEKARSKAGASAAFRSSSAELYEPVS